MNLHGPFRPQGPQLREHPANTSNRRSHAVPVHGRGPKTASERAGCYTGRYTIAVEPSTRLSLVWIHPNCADPSRDPHAPRISDAMLQQSPIGLGSGAEIQVTMRNSAVAMASTIAGRRAEFQPRVRTVFTSEINCARHRHCILRGTGLARGRRPAVSQPLGFESRTTDSTAEPRDELIRGVGTDAASWIKGAYGLSRPASTGRHRCHRVRLVERLLAHRILRAEFCKRAVAFESCLPDCELQPQILPSVTVDVHFGGRNSDSLCAGLAEPGRCGRNVRRLEASGREKRDNDAGPGRELDGV